MDKFVIFNLCEGLFWIILGVIAYIIFSIVDKKYKLVSLVSSLALGLFGISDLLESKLGSFLGPGLEWLYVWKIINLIVLVIIFGWYLKIATKK